MNDQNKKQVIIAGVLLAVLAGVLVYQFVLRGAPELPESVKTAQATPAPTAAPAPTPAGVPAPAPFPQGTPAQEELDIRAMIASVEVKPIDYAQVRVARDPMAPLVGQLTPEEMVENQAGAPGEAVTQVKIDTTASKQVTGIIWDKNYPVAVVDDVVVHVGYVFPNGARVDKIEPTRVLFKVGDTTIPVEMKEY